MDTLKAMGYRLKVLRKEQRIRQVDMADFLGITPTHYRRIEAGKINIPTLTLCALADHFAVSTDYLLGRTENRRTPE